MYDSWVAFFRTQSRRNLYQFYGGAPIRRVRFTKATKRHANIRETKVRRSEKIKSKFLISAVPTLRNLRIGLREETERQERRARGDVWRLPRKSYTAPRKGQIYLFLTYQRMKFTSSIRNKTGGKRVCCRFRQRACTCLSRKDLNSAELETVKVSESPTMVVAANGEVQTEEEATVYGHSKTSRRNTGRSLTRKILRRSWIFLPLDQWSETTIHQRWQTKKCKHGELRTDCCP